MTSPPKILQVLPALQAGGVERGTIEMVRAIVQAGGEAIVASAGGRLVPLVERAGGRHVTLKLLSKDPLTIWLNAGRLARLIEREQIALVHARSRAPAWSAYWAARRTRTPFVTTWHGVYSENLPGKRRYNAVMAKGERVIAISAYVGARIAHNYGVGPDRLRVIPRGADIAAFDPAALQGDRLHRLARDWQLPDNARVVMLPGRITRWKGHALLVDALARLQDRQAVCVMVGPLQEGGRGAARFARELIEQARASGVLDRLRFGGQCDDMPAAFALADVVAVPSLKPEPFGRVVVEAQAMGRPVVVSAHGAAMETVEDGLTGWLVPPGDAQALADAIDAALALSPEDRHNLGGWARHRVAERYTTRAMQAATLGVYEELLGPVFLPSGPRPEPASAETPVLA